MTPGAPDSCPALQAPREPGRTPEIGSLSSGRFEPPFCLKNGFVQTVLASARFRARGCRAVGAAASEVILESRQGVRLLGFLSAHTEPTGKGLAILLHGWEGSSNSTYVTVSSEYLFSQGFDVFRLNLRDHGPTHHLNPGLFFVVLLDEVFDAVRQAAAMSRGYPAFLAGFSLGGNFVLRIARRCVKDPISQLRHCVAISPVLDPGRATDAVDRTIFIRRYFLKKWKRSLAIKEALFPDLYDFSFLYPMTSIREMTDRILKAYSRYPSADAYFRDYTLLGSDLADLTLPATVITAADDPVIPVRDFYDLVLGRSSRLIIHPCGGHVGFIQDRSMRSWCEPFLARLFQGASNEAYSRTDGLDPATPETFRL